MVIPSVDHDCVLKNVVIELSNKLAKVEHELAQLKKSHIGPKSERAKVTRIPATPSTKKERDAKRAANAAEKAQTQSLRHEHKVPDEQRTCPKCGDTELKRIGDGRKTTVWDFEPARFIKHVHVQEVLKCRCEDYVVTAPVPAKVVERGRYGSGFLAHLAIAKCADHIPIYRLEKEFRRQGFPLARSTMNELLHRTSAILEPIWKRILDNIKGRPIVLADETRMRMQDGGDGKPKNGFVWTFVAADDVGALDVALFFAADRSGETPRAVLGGTDGVLLVDAYSGYNSISDVSTRRRAACHAHLRRYFHEALATAPIAQEAIDLILDLYRVEHEAKRRKIVGGPLHLQLRRAETTAARARLRAWLDEQRPRHPPKSPIGVAINYGLKRWEDLGVFLNDARVPIDNNASERSLRRVALGRKNYLFVGDVNAGASIAGLYTIIATCEARAVNPFVYLADVIPRVQDHPADRLDELLPGPWLDARCPNPWRRARPPPLV